ncbi:CLUMA_CG016780, isoform A [Clunio marinus]|uniref:CLUMA_CG016780, isoform A n=1 Tax=Clunio marinus TaxID=568069 RepID=A0A1J1IWV0_9DIPT|nr:CLUMA_CG016780, isoform A [Clunio marinus]
MFEKRSFLSTLQQLNLNKKSLPLGSEAEAVAEAGSLKKLNFLRSRSGSLEAFSEFWEAEAEAWKLFQNFEKPKRKLRSFLRKIVKLPTPG